MALKSLMLASAFVIGSVPAMAQQAPPPPPAEAMTTAEPYVMAAGQSDLYEINSSQVALQKSQNPQIRKFATTLIKHHQKTTAATMKAAQRDGLSPSAPMLDPGATTSVNELQTASAADFDRLYIAQQIPAHKAALDLHQSYSTNGDKTALRKSAKAAVPIVKQHLAMAMKMQSGGSGSMPGM